MSRYRLLGRLGAGGMSVVWRAHDDVLDRDVAVKVLSAGAAAGPGLADRIKLEARAAARLHHPNVIEVYDFGQTADGLPYIVMELVDGRPLSELVAGGALDRDTAVRICGRVATALAAAHAQGVVHRDVKPGNVMITGDGVKLVDFGISATIGEADRIAGELYGTPAYLAPERLADGTVRPATDVYALGLLLYLTLAGRLPWRASSTTQMLRAHRYREPAALPRVEGLPVAVSTLVHRCLAKNPADRPTAAEAARVLTDPAVTAAQQDTVRIAGPAPRRARRPAAAMVAAALAVTGGLVWWSTVDGSERAEATDTPTTACTVGYAVRSSVDGRLSTAVTLTNTGTGPAADWALDFALPGNQRLVRGWSGSWAQTGRSIRLTGSALPAGGRVSTGFDATYRGNAALPVQFRLNETVCETHLSVVGAAATTPGPAAPTAPATAGAAAARTPAARASAAQSAAARRAQATRTATRTAPTTTDNSGSGRTGNDRGNNEDKEKDRDEGKDKGKDEKKGKDKDD